MANKEALRLLKIDRKKNQPKNGEGSQSRESLSRNFRRLQEIIKETETLGSEAEDKLKPN